MNFTMNGLGEYLRSRRTQLDPAALALGGGRRRTPGLRREEVALRASISTTWYTWLEQGRGGPPSADVLDRLATALLLTAVEREHLFLLGLGRPPPARYRGVDAVDPALQRVLDGMPDSPALIRTATWDVVAWNHAACTVLLDFGSYPPAERNLLRLLFCDPRLREAQADWKNVARFLVSAFRHDAARAGASEEIAPLVRELSLASPEFERLWRAPAVFSPRGEGTKRFRHPVLGALALEYAVFAVDARPDLKLVVMSATTPEDRRRIRTLTRRKTRNRGPVDP